MERPLEKGIVRASSSSLPARDDEGEKGPPPEDPDEGVEIWVGSLTKNIFKKITKNS